MTNIINMPTPKNVLGERIKKAYERTQHGRHEWIEGTLELAATLAEARTQFPADKQFSMWLAENELDFDKLGHQSRAALIHMAANLPLARLVLQETERTSWQLVWSEEMRSRFTSASKPPVQIEKHEEPRVEPEEIEKPDRPEVPRAQIPKKLLPTSPLYGLKRGAEVAEMYPVRARSVLGDAMKARSRVSYEIWGLVLTAIDAGFVTAPTPNFSSLTMRHLFPKGEEQYGLRYKLTEKLDREHIVKVIMPTALKHREAILEDQTRLEGLVRGIDRRQTAAALEAQVVEKLKALPTNEGEVIVYGQRMWPMADGDHRFGSYDYNQLRAAIWMFKDFLAWVDRTKVAPNEGSVCIIARRWATYPLQYVSIYLPTDEGALRVRKIFQVFGTIAGLYQKNPAGETTVLPSPTTEGVWPS